MTDSDETFDVEAVAAAARTRTTTRSAPKPATTETTETTETRETLIEQAARKHDLPDDVLDLLTGTTAEDIEKQAAALARHAALRPALTPGTTGTNADHDDDFDVDHVVAAVRGFRL